VVSGNPYNSLSLLDDIVDDVVAYGMNISRLGFINGKILPVERIQSVPCPEPHDFGRILPDTINRTV
jgi:hypothetical protein